MRNNATNSNKAGTRAITASDLFIDIAQEQKKAIAKVKANRRYNEQVLGLLHVLAGLEDAVRTRRVSGVKASPEYSAVLTQLKKVETLAFRYDANIAGLWAEKCTIYGNDMLNY